MNEHTKDCTDYKNFFEKLIDGNKKGELNKVFEKDGKDGYLEYPVGKVKMCCCRSNVPHNESQKFMILGSEVAKSQRVFMPKHE